MSIIAIRGQLSSPTFCFFSSIMSLNEKHNHQTIQYFLKRDKVEQVIRDNPNDKNLSNHLLTFIWFFHHV
jgi:hypothetical protein